MIRLKFKSGKPALSTQGGKKVGQVNLTPIECEENRCNWHEVPTAGALSLNNLTADATAAFVDGGEYYVDIYPVGTPQSMLSHPSQDYFHHKGEPHPPQFAIPHSQQDHNIAGNTFHPAQQGQQVNFHEIKSNAGGSQSDSKGF